jgi:hypothetical protein
MAKHTTGPRTERPSSQTRHTQHAVVGPEQRVCCRCCQSGVLTLPCVDHTCVAAVWTVGLCGWLAGRTSSERVPKVQFIHLTRRGIPCRSSLERAW